MKAPRRRWGTLASVAGGLILAGYGWTVYGQYRAVAAVPVATATRSAFIDEISVRGDVRPLRSLSVAAPAMAGDLRIVTLTKNGSAVRKGDVVAQFDTTSLQRTLDERRSDLRQAEAEINRLRGDARIREEQDVTEVAKARYDVERARLDVSTEALISRVDADKFRLALADAEQRQAEAERRLEANRRGAAADLESRRQKREKAAAEVAKAERDLAALTLRAPGDGTLTILDNWRASGPMGGSTREFREGDRAWSGASIAEVPNLDVVEIVARIDEADRGRIRDGQTATVRVDALPDRELRATVKSISTLAKVVFDGWPPVKQFEMRLALLETDPRLRSGMTAMARVAAERLEQQLLVPTRAVFQKEGRSVVYVRRTRGWDERTLVIGRRNADQVVVTQGLADGDRVALKDPMADREQGGGR